MINVISKVFTLSQMSKSKHFFTHIKEFLIEEFGKSFIGIILLRLMPKNRRLLLFDESHGFGDNTAYLMEWVLQNRPDLKPIWVTGDKEIYSDLHQQNIPVVYRNSVKSIFYLSRAKIVVTNSTLRGLLGSASRVKSTNVVNLHHGFPIRAKNRLNKPRNERLKYSEDQETNPPKERMYDYRICISDFAKDVYMRLYDHRPKVHLPRERYKVTGLPRNDSLLNPPKENKKNWLEYFNGTVPETVILYAPTHRYSDENKYLDFEKLFFVNGSVEKIDSYLENRELTLLIRLHPTDYRLVFEEYIDRAKATRNQIDKLKGSDRIRLVNKNQEYIRDANELLPFVDILITDFSSIFHDFLLLNKPILFAPYDYHKFRTEGFTYDYKEKLPGPEVHSINELMDSLDELLSGEDRYEKRRQQLKNKLHKYDDANSCERVMELIENIRDS